MGKTGAFTGLAMDHTQDRSQDSYRSARSSCGTNLDPSWLQLQMSRESQHSSSQIGARVCPKLN